MLQIENSLYVVTHASVISVFTLCVFMPYEYFVAEMASENLVTPLSASLVPFGVVLIVLLIILAISTLKYRNKVVSG